MFKFLKPYKDYILCFFQDLNLNPWKKQSFVFQGYIIQFLIFSYSIFRYLSRSYESYGFLNDQSFSYPRWWLADLYPLPISHFSTFQFIYDFFPRLNPDNLMYIQYLIVVFSIFGLLGILPRLSAFVSFILATHLEGILISSDAEISGGTCLFACLILIVLCKKNSLYRINKIFSVKYKI